MKKLRIIPYNMGSNSVRALAGALGVLRVKPNSSTYVHRKGTVLINWGNSSALTISHNVEDVINHPQAVAKASNKLKTLELLDQNNVPTLNHTTDREVVSLWLGNGSIVLARTKLNGHSGDGIVVMKPGDAIVDAPLYTQYKKKRNEYRVHVFNGAVIDIQEKKRASEAAFELDSPEALIRSHHNGWNFCRENVQIEDRELLEEIAVDAVTALGLHFGAVDIIYNHHYRSYHVLEVNTAPGLEGTTLQKYVEAIKQL